MCWGQPALPLSCCGRPGSSLAWGQHLSQQCLSQSSSLAPLALWVAPHKAWLFCTLLWLHVLAPWAHKFPRDTCWAFLSWKGLQFWNNLRFHGFVCFLESNPGFVLSLLRAVPVDVAVAWCRILRLHAGPFWMEFPVFPMFKQFYRHLSISNQCEFLSSSSSSSLHALKVQSHACSRLSIFFFFNVLERKPVLPSLAFKFVYWREQ